MPVTRCGADLITGGRGRELKKKWGEEGGLFATLANCYANEAQQSTSTGICVCAIMTILGNRFIRIYTCCGAVPLGCTPKIYHLRTYHGHGISKVQKTGGGRDGASSNQFHPQAFRFARESKARCNSRTRKAVPHGGCSHLSDRSEL